MDATQALELPELPPQASAEGVMAAKKSERVRARLTPKQKRFALEYLVDLNATQAAIRAGYSKRSAKEQAYELLQNPLVAAEVRAAQATLKQKLQVTVEDVVAELRAVGFARITDFASFGPNGVTMLDSADIDAQKLAAVAEVRDQLSEGVRVGTVLKLHNKIDAIVALAKHLGMFVEKHEHKVTEGKVSFYLPSNGRRPEPREGNQ